MSDKTKLVPVQYIGTKDQWKDRLYDSGLNFEKNQVHNVPELLSRKLLRHADLFKQPDAKATDKEPKDAKAQPDTTEAMLEKGKQEKAEKDKAVNRIADLHDEVAQMDKDALERFAKENWNQELDKRQSVEKLRGQVTGWLDEFGVV